MSRRRLFPCASWSAARVLDLAVSRRLDDAARPEPFAEFRILRVEPVLRILLGIEVVKVAEELIKAVIGRQVLVAVAQMVLAELAGRVAERLEQFGERRVARLQADGRAGDADLGQTGAQLALPCNEG